METPSLRYLKELSSGNKNFELKIFKLLLDELQKEYTEYQTAISDKKYYLASEIVHKMMHKIAFFQMRKSLLLAEKHELALMSGTLKYQSEFQETICNILKLTPEQDD
ncbi:hypothetical protein [Algoriphagus vanfongensis]|uniref:hypothetical protein n=1 Tax=Algoriphagus vanfongensis TaxID=426371 RepID=UPI0004296AD2|nr:hypothetical protein [Algoriphagus vanfongensis]